MEEAGRNRSPCLSATHTKNQCLDAVVDAIGSWISDQLLQMICLQFVAVFSCILVSLSLHIHLQALKHTARRNAPNNADSFKLCRLLTFAFNPIRSDQYRSLNIPHVYMYVYLNGWLQQDLFHTLAFKTECQKMVAWWLQKKFE